MTWRALSISPSSNQETRAQNVFDDVAITVHQTLLRPAILHRARADGVHLAADVGQRRGLQRLGAFEAASRGTLPLFRE